MDPWSELVVLAERESAREQLERLARLQSQIGSALQSARAFTAQELARTRRGRIAVRGYGASLAPSPSQVDSLR
jgi:hypothetical protein